MNLLHCSVFTMPCAFAMPWPFLTEDNVSAKPKKTASAQGVCAEQLTTCSKLPTSSISSVTGSLDVLRLVRNCCRAHNAAQL